MKIVYNAELDSVAFKDAFGATIPRLAEQDPDVVYLDADLMSCVGTTKWAKQNPTRGINCGIAEANMIGIACGLAATGLKPIVHTFGPFASRRCFDQAFLSGGYAGNSITIVGSDPGVCAGFNGGTHMPFEDVALYRSLPEATVIDVTDTAMLISVLEQAKDLPGVKYIRMGRKECYKFFETGEKMPIGKAITVREGKDAVVFASGIMLHESMVAANNLAKEGIDVAVVNIFTIKPIDAEAICKYAQSTGAVVTAENHNKIGGLYSAVTEVLSAKCPVPVEYVAVEDVFGEVGPQNYLQERFGLTSTSVETKLRAVLKRK